MTTRLALAAVFFDWDGTLVDSAEASFSTYRRLFGSFGLAAAVVRAMFESARRA